MTTPPRNSVHDREVFRFLTWAWDITLAHDLTSNSPILTVDITPLTGFAKLVAVNPARVAVADLTRPLLVAPLPNAGNLVIDGWHRIHRALQEQVTHLPAIVLTAEDERHCRLRGEITQQRATRS